MQERKIKIVRVPGHMEVWRVEVTSPAGNYVQHLLGNKEGCTKVAILTAKRFLEEHEFRLANPHLFPQIKKKSKKANKKKIPFGMKYILKARKQREKSNDI